MICPRCQGLIINGFGDLRCANCGHRPTQGYVPPAIDRMKPDREALVHDDEANRTWSLMNRKKRGKDKQKRKTHA